MDAVVRTAVYCDITESDIFEMMNKVSNATSMFSCRQIRGNVTD